MVVLLYFQTVLLFVIFRGWRSATATGARLGSVRVTSEDKLPRKPAPDMLQHLMAKYNLPPEECLMVGDRPLDTEAGVNAGVLSVLLDMEDCFPAGRCDLRIPAAEKLIDLLT